MQTLFIAIAAVLIGREAGAADPLVKQCPTQQFQVDARSEDAKDAGILRIGTFNTDFLFRKAEYPPEMEEPLVACPIPNVQSPKAEFTLETCRWAAKEVKTHADGVAAFLAAAKVDIWALQEVQDCGILEHVVKTSDGLKDHKPLLQFGGDTATGQQVALLTRVPADTVAKNNPALVRRVHTDVSKAAYSVFRVAGFPKEIVLVNLHLIAKRATDSDRRREQQAMRVAAFVKAAKKDGRHVIVVGDFNDGDHDVKLPVLVRHYSKALEIIKNAGLVNAAASAVGLESITKDSDRYTFNSQAIDHVLVDEELVEALARVEVVKAPTEVSDHNAVVITLDASKLLQQQHAADDDEEMQQLSKKDRKAAKRAPGSGRKRRQKEAASLSDLDASISTDASPVGMLSAASIDDKTFMIGLQL